MHKEENEVNTKISVLDFSAQEESQAEEMQIFRCLSLRCQCGSLDP